MPDTQRYNRQIILPEIGQEGQLLLSKAKVLMVGAGGLGCPALQYLAAAGVGTIGIIDHDVVDLSNLQRQILFTNGDLGKSKAITAKAKLNAQNPEIEIIAYNEALTIQNAQNLIAQFDLVIDGTDNFATRYLVNDVCVKLSKPFIAASILRFEGQISVYNYQNGPTYRCLFPEPPQDALTCSEAGVIGVLGGIMGSLQANEAIKIITKIGEVLSGKLFVINALNLQNYTLSFERSAHWNNFNELDYASFCVTDDIELEVSPLALNNIIDDVFLIDIRAAQEYKRNNIGGINVLSDAIFEIIGLLPSNKTIVVCCNSGITSLNLVKKLKNKFKQHKIVSLKGGVSAYLSL